MNARFLGIDPFQLHLFFSSLARAHAPLLGKTGIAPRGRPLLDPALPETYRPILNALGRQALHGLCAFIVETKRPDRPWPTGVMYESARTMQNLALSWLPFLADRGAFADVPARLSRRKKPHPSLAAYVALGRLKHTGSAEDSPSPASHDSSLRYRVLGRAAKNLPDVLADFFAARPEHAPTHELLALACFAPDDALRKDAAQALGAFLKDRRQAVQLLPTLETLRLCDREDVAMPASLLCATIGAKHPDLIGESLFRGLLHDAVFGAFEERDRPAHTQAILRLANDRRDLAESGREYLAYFQLEDPEDKPLEPAQKSRLEALSRLLESALKTAPHSAPGRAASGVTATTRRFSIPASVPD